MKMEDYAKEPFNELMKTFKDSGQYDFLEKLTEDELWKIFLLITFLNLYRPYSPQLADGSFIRANDIVSGIKWANKILDHCSNNRRFSFRIDTTRDSIENHDIVSCPNWLRDAIKDIVSNKKKEWQEELENL